MSRQLKEFLHPPIFPDEDQNRVARTLYTILLIFLVAAALVIVAGLLARDGNTVTALAVGGSAVLGILRLAQQRRIQLAGFLVLLVLLIMMVFLQGVGRGIHDISIMIYPVVIIVASLLLSRRAFSVITLLTILTAWGIIVAEVNGLIFNELTRFTNYYDLVTTSIILAITAVSVRLLSDNLLHSIAQARQNASALAESNQQLRKALRAYRTLSDCNQAVVRATEEAALLQEVCRIIVQNGGYCQAWVGLAASDQTEQIKPAAQAGYDLGQLEALHLTWVELQSEPHPTAEAIRRGTPYIVQNVFTDPDYVAWRPEATQRGYAGLIALPLRTNGHTWGALTIYTVEPDVFDADEVSLLQELAGDLAYGVMALRTRAELRENEQRYRALFERTNDAVFIISLDAVHLAVNQQAADLLGYSVDEMVGMPTQQVIAPYEYPDSQGKLAAILAGESLPVYEQVFRHKDGRDVPAEINAALVYDAVGNPSHIQSIVRDITERKRAEEALRESEERFRSIFENAVMGLYRSTPDGRLLMANPALVRMLGYSSFEELAQLNLEKNGYAPDFARSVFRQRTESEGQVIGFESGWRKRDGSTLFIRENARAIRDDAGNTLYYEGTVEDVTERVRAEEAERRRLEQLEALYQVLQDLTLLQDLDALLHQIVGRALRLLGRQSGGISLYRPECQKLEWVVNVGKELAPIGFALERGEGIGGQVWATSQPLIVNDYQAWSGKSPQRSDLDAAVVAVPIQWSERFLGVLIVADHTAHPFDAQDAALLSQFATQAAIAIHNAELYAQAQQEIADRKQAEESLEQRHRQLTILYQAATAINSDLALSTVLRTVAEQMTQALNTDGCALSLWRREHDQIEMVVDYSIVRPNETMPSGTIYDLNKYPTTRQMLESGRPVLIQHDDPTLDAAQQALVNEWRALTLLMLPLVVRDQVVGLVELVNEVARHDYTAEDMRLAESLAAQACAAVENARLYDQARQEIAERKRAEAEIVRLQHLLQNITDSMPSTLIALDATGRVLTWNPAAETLTGYPIEQIRGQNVWQICPPLIRYQALFEQVIRKRQVVQQSREQVITADGAAYRDVSVFPLMANDIEGVVLRIDDVTRRVQMEEMMLQSAKMASVGGLAAGVAHEINNPLGAMLQGAQVLQLALDTHRPRTRDQLMRMGLDPDRLDDYLQERRLTDYIEGIRSAGARAAKIVSDLLSFSRQRSSELAPHNLNALVEQTLALAAADYDLKKKYDFKDIHILRQLADELPQVECDDQQIQQVILNLVRNAGQAMSSADMKRLGYHPQLNLRTSLRENYIRLEVEDNGPGISELAQGRLFEPFFTTKEMGEGTGLGLWLCWSIVVERHKGRIWAEPGPEGGTRFVIELPLAQAAQQEYVAGEQK